MRTFKHNKITLLLATATMASFCGSALLAQPKATVNGSSIEVMEETVIRLGARGNGKTWRGSIGDTVEVTFYERGSKKTFTGTLDTYREIGRNLATLSVAGMSDGKSDVRTFVVGDVVSITTVEEAKKGTKPAVVTNTNSDAPSKGSATSSKATENTTPAPATSHGWGFPTAPGPEYDHLPKIFMLPIQGGVGDGTRHNEMKQIGEIADSYGPGQIIIFKVDSPGGLVLEADMIHETLMDLKRRHRLIAWVEEAISAAAFTSFHCNEVYFMKTGALGSATMFAGGKAIEGERLRQWVKKFGDVAEESGHPRALAEAMVTNSEMCSYDPADGDTPPVIYDNMDGKIVLSTNEENLTINATDAIACGFADGIADNEDELAELLNLPHWYETTDDGRKIHERWQKTLDIAKLEIPRLLRQLMGQTGMTNDELKNINRQLTACNKLIAWSRRVGNHTSMMMQIPPMEALEEIKKQLLEQLRRLKEQQRG